MHIAGEGIMHRVSWLILIQVFVLLSPSHVWGMEKHEKRESNTHQDSSSKQTDQQKTSAKSDQVQQDKHAPTSSTFEAMFNSIIEMFKQRQEPPLVSRGNLCVLSPGVLGLSNEILGSQPLFLWQGKVEKIIVRDYETNNILWLKNNLEDINEIVYKGKSLKAGQSYIWEFINPHSRVRHEFTVMSKTKQKKILDKFESSMLSENTGISIDRIKLNEALFLTKENLWSDSLSSLYSINYSKKYFKKIASSLCDT